MVGMGCAEEGAGAGGGAELGVGCLVVEGAGSLGGGAGLLEEGRATEIIVGVSKPSSSVLPTLAMRTFKGSARKRPGETFGACELAEVMMEILVVLTLTMLLVLMMTMLLVLMLAMLVVFSTLARSRALVTGRRKESSTMGRWRSILRFGLRGHYLSVICESVPLRVLSPQCAIYEHTSLCPRSGIPCHRSCPADAKITRSCLVGRRGGFIHFVVSRTSRARITLEKEMNARLGYFGMMLPCPENRFSHCLSH